MVDPKGVGPLLAHLEKQRNFLTFNRTANERNAADHLAFEDVEGGEQRRRTVSFVVMGHGPRAPWLHRQARLSSIECLDLALLVE